MEPKKNAVKMFLFILSLSILGCGPGQIMGSLFKSTPAHASPIATRIPVPTKTQIPTQSFTPTTPPDPAAVLEANGFVSITAGASCDTPCRIYNHRDTRIGVDIYDDGKLHVIIDRENRVGTDIFQAQLDFLDKILAELYPADVVSLVIGNARTANEKGPSGTGSSTTSSGGYLIVVKPMLNDPKSEPIISVTISPK